MGELSMADDQTSPSQILQDATKSLAEGIVSNLIDGASGTASDLALGFITSALGIGGGESDALDEIKSLLNDIKRSIDQLRSEMTERFDQEALDIAEGKVSPLIAKNKLLLHYFIDLAECNKEDIPSQLSLIDGTLKHETPSDMMEQWDTNLAPTATSTSLIQALQRKIVDSAPVYGPIAAEAAENLWRFYDMHQAISLVFTIERLMLKGAKGEIKPTVERWLESRASQISQLRGMASAQDTVWVADALEQEPRQVTTALNHLPAGCAISRSQNLMWSLDFTHRIAYTFPGAPPNQPPFPLPSLDTSQDNRAWLERADGFYTMVNGAIGAATGKTVQPDGTAFTDWRLCDRDTMISLETACGAVPGSDVFVAQMKGLGFQFDESQQVAILTELSRTQDSFLIDDVETPYTYVAYFIVYEQRDWSYPDGSLPYIIPACRNVSAEEMSQYIQ